MKAFKGMNKKFIRITNNSAKWSNDKGKGYLIDYDTLIAGLLYFCYHWYCSLQTNHWHSNGHRLRSLSS